MTDKRPANDQPVLRKKCTLAFNAACVRQVAAGVRQTDVGRAQGISPSLLSRWQRTALEQAVPSSAERDEIKRLRAELRRMEIERDILKKRQLSLHGLSRKQVFVYQQPTSCLNAGGLVPRAGRES